jgi:hypothetical protein
LLATLPEANAEIWWFKKPLIFCIFYFKIFPAAEILGKKKIKIKMPLGYWEPTWIVVIMLMTYLLETAGMQSQNPMNNQFFFGGGFPLCSEIIFLGSKK